MGDRSTRSCETACLANQPEPANCRLVHAWHSHAEAILALALQADPPVREQAIRLIDYLGRRGYTDFGSLLYAAPARGRPQASAAAVDVTDVRKSRAQMGRRLCQKRGRFVGFRRTLRVLEKLCLNHCLLTQRERSPVLDPPVPGCDDLVATIVRWLHVRVFQRSRRTSR